VTVGAKFFQAGKRAGVASHDHGQTVAITMAVVDPTVWPWQPSPVLLAQFCGQRTPRTVVTLFSVMF